MHLPITIRLSQRVMCGSAAQLANRASSSCFRGSHMASHCLVQEGSGVCNTTVMQGCLPVSMHPVSMWTVVCTVQHALFMCRGVIDCEAGLVAVVTLHAMCSVPCALPPCKDLVYEQSLYRPCCTCSPQVDCTTECWLFNRTLCYSQPCCAVSCVL